MVLLAFFLAALTSVPGSARAEPDTGPGARETVVLLHGLARTHRSLRPLEQHLERAGYLVYNLPYPSTEGSPEELVAEIAAQVRACCSHAPVVHFVGHSLGGILARAYLANGPELRPGRMVMLAPPNHGSELVDALGSWTLFQKALGPTAVQLGTGASSFPNRLPKPEVEVGIIAGSGSVNPFASWLLPEGNDGVVSIASTKLEDMSDFLLVPSSHTFIMRSDEVSRQVVHFLRHGAFDREERER